MKKLPIGEISVIIAAALWGCISVTTRPLGDMGFLPIQITAVRAFLTTTIMAAFILIKDRSLFKIKWRDLPVFMGTGIVSFLFFNFCYMSSIEENSVSVAAMLLYTSPIWITVISRIIFKEKITWVKAAALFGAVAGAAMLTFSQGASTTPAGVLFGLGSGLGYALYSIFGKIAGRKYSTETITFYTFVFASIGGLPLCSPIDLVTGICSQPISLIYFIVCTVFMTVLPYIFYTKGLIKISAGKAGIISIIEPIVASVVGLVVYSETINVLGIVGIVIVIASLVLLELKKESPPKETESSTE